MTVPGEMAQKYIEIRVRFKYRLYFCASRKSLTPPRLMSASELTLQPVHQPRQAVQVFSGRSGFFSVLTAFEKLRYPFFYQTFTDKGLPQKAASKVYPQKSLNSFLFTINLGLNLQFTMEGLGISLSDYDLTIKTCKLGVEVSQRPKPTWTKVTKESTVS